MTLSVYRFGDLYIKQQLREKLNARFVRKLSDKSSIWDSYVTIDIDSSASQEDYEKEGQRSVLDCNRLMRHIQ